MIARKVRFDELPSILRLYQFLHPEDPVVSADSEAVSSLWNRISHDSTLHYFVTEQNGRIVSTCTLTVIPNLTRGLRPYGVIENVVTDPEFRKKGHATAVLRCALVQAWSSGCYKVMLETGSKREDTLRFNESAGFKRGIKTGFIAYPERNEGGEPGATDNPDGAQRLREDH